MSDVQIVGEISMETKDAAQAVLDLKKKVKELSEELKNSEEGSKAQRDAFIKLQQAQKDLGDANKKLGDTMKENESTASKFKSGVKSLWQEQFKAISVFALAAGALNMFKEALGKNQKVADFMATTMNFLNKVFNDFVEFIISNVVPAGKSIGDTFGKVGAFLKDVFTNPLENIKKFGDAIKENIAERFRSLLDSVGYLGKGLKSLFAGELNEAIGYAKKAGKEFLDVGTGINNTADKAATVFSKVVDGVKNAASGIADYTKKSWNAAAAQVALQNQAKLASARLQGLVEEYDRQAESQRQIRDDESKSIEERIAANNKLGEVLDKQQKTMLQLAATKVAAAQADLAANKGSLDLQVALIQAQNEQKAIIAQVTGLQSEQKVNAVALTKEQLERDKIILESANKIKYERLRGAAELIEDELAKAQTLKQINADEATDELKRLTDNINNTNAGTQARVDAEIAYNEKKKEIDIAADAGDANIKKIQQQREKDLLLAKSQNSIDFIALKKSLAENEITDEITRSNKLIAIAREEHDAKQALIIAQRDAEIAAAEKQGLDTKVIKDKYNTQLMANDEAYAQSQKNLSDAIVQAKMQEYTAIADLASQLSDLVGKQTVAGKALGIAQGLINTYVGITEVWKSKAVLPEPFNTIQKIASTVATAAGGFKAVKAIAAVNIPGGSGGGGGSVPSAPSVSAPVLPVQSSTRLDSGSIQAVGNAAQGGVAKAFVLSSDIKDENEKMELINKQARIG
jgi:hypothetical protein